jgi:glycosyltransferase involved in cell wall biosynthesis
MNLTVITCARDAAATIERAIASVLAETGCRLLLVDDGCRDATVALARRAAGDRLRVVAAPPPGGIPRARQAGLDACETEFAAWLDADDVWVPGRAARIVGALAGGADVFCDAIDLVDGASGRGLRRLDVPMFLRRESSPARLFERNHLPGDTQVGFRVATFRAAGGYDPEVFGVESFDLLLRVIARGVTFAWGENVGYRMYAYAGSVSRDLVRQRASLALALKKHDYEHVRGLCHAAGQPPRVAAWVLVSMALFRREPEAALRFLEEASPADANPDDILEADGPWPIREGWRRAFQRGTCFALIRGRDEEAIAELLAARSLEVTAEQENNLGVVLARVGRTTEARECWNEALQRVPGYLDARMNLEDRVAGRITTHPLRRLASRSEY